MQEQQTTQVVEQRQLAGRRPNRTRGRVANGNAFLQAGGGGGGGGGNHLLDDSANIITDDSANRLLNA